MADILSKYNSLNAASKKQVRDLIYQLMDKKGVSKKQHTSFKKSILLISTWCEQDKQLIAKWSEKIIN